MVQVEGDIADRIKHWLPLVIMKLSEDKTVRGRKRFQKLVFLAEVEGHLGEFFRFEPHHYGPYSSALQDTLDHLKVQGYINENEVEMSGVTSPRRDYTITESGMKQVKNLERGIPADRLLGKLTPTLTKYLSMSTSEILRYVYGQYSPPAFYDHELLNSKVSSLERGLERYRDFWLTLKDEHYPLSVFVLALYDQIQLTLDAIGDIDPLDSHVICGAAFDLVGSTKDLLHQVEMYGCGIEGERPSGVQAALEEIRDILAFIEEFGENRGVLTSLDRIVISDILSEEEQKAISDDMKKELERIL